MTKRLPGGPIHAKPYYFMVDIPDNGLTVVKLEIEESVSANLKVNGDGKYEFDYQGIHYAEINNGVMVPQS